MTRQDIFEYYQNTLCVNQDVFLELKLLDYNQLQNSVRKDRRKMTRLRTAGRGRTGLIKWESIPREFRRKIKKHFGDPYQKENVERFIARLQNDDDAAIFVAKANVSPERERELYVEIQILNAYTELNNEWQHKAVINKEFRVTEARAVAAKVIQELKLIKRPDGNLEYPHRLPANPVSLKRRWDDFIDNGFDALLHGNRGSRNAAKIQTKNGNWLIAKYAQPNKPTAMDLWQEYNVIRKHKNWPTLTEDAIYKFLMRPENEKIWYLGRHGKGSWINKFGHKITRDKEDWFPNVYLSIDGSKLDWVHYKDRGGKNYNMAADIWFDCVFDIYSEKIIGYYAGTDHENYTQHFSALKMALGTSLEKPAMLTYDNQGGHRKHEMQQLYDKIISKGGKHYPHKANEHGSPVEQIFSRLQQQVFNKVWYSDKQAVTAIREDSHPNMDFIRRHRDKLLTVDECLERVQFYVDKWNAMPHPKFPDQSRNQVYNHAASFELDKINELDVLDLFWIFSKDTVTYRSTGLSIKKKLKGETKTYLFEVYDANGDVDLDFRDKYTGAKFYYQYDPELFDMYVRLYLALPNGEMKYVADAELAKGIKSIDQLMQKQDHKHKAKMLDVRNKEIARIQAQLDKIQNDTGINEDSLIAQQEFEYKNRLGLNKEQRSEVESNYTASKY